MKIALSFAWIVLFALNVQASYLISSNGPEKIDTLPVSEFPSINQTNVCCLTAENGVLVATMVSGEKHVIRREEFERYLGKNETSRYKMTFTKMEIEPDFPGGSLAWQQYLEKNLHYPKHAHSKKLQGTIGIRFIVDQDGTAHDFERVSGLDDRSITEEAFRLMKESGKWNAAIQNFHLVRAYATRYIHFELP